MKSGVEQLCKKCSRHVPRGFGKYWKRAANRALRRWIKRDPENAPKRMLLRGYTD